MKKTLLFFLIFLLPFLILAQQQEYYVLKVEGIIDAANSDYIVKAIKMAEDNNVSGVILQINTPGGLMKSMRTIVDKILESKVPIITYVSPKGARAASAGTFILLASHIAAMAQGTNIGTASPIDFTGNKAAEKITNDSIVYIKNLARLRDKNQKWAEETITKNISSSEEEALKLKVIDIIAKDMDDLIKKLDGKKVKINEKEIVLNTKEGKFTDIELSGKHKFVHFLADPNLTYILFLVGTYGIIYELAHPGVLFPGVAGAIALVFAFIGFESLPINVAGLILIGLSLALFIAEAMTPTFGTLFTGGIITLILGSILLFPSRGIDSVWAPSYWVIGTMVVITTVLIGIILAAIIKSLRSKKMMSKESLIGLKGIAETEITPEGGVANVGAEEWKAYSDEKIKAREVIEVVEVEGLKMKVKKIPRKKED
jgi:membrane-bound serine protease (ClpP class)